MDEKSPSLESIDVYIESFPANIQERLQAIRRTIRAAVPEATEKISWQMPTFYLKGNLIHFAVHAHHIGLYPGASGIENFKSEFAAYKSSKGAVQFPLSEPLPLELIARIAVFRAMENLQLDEERKMIRKKKKTD